MYPSYLLPPEKRYRILTVEHEDGSIYDYPYHWPSESQETDMLPREIGYEEFLRDFNIWIWAENIENGIVKNSKVVAILDDWYGTLRDLEKKRMERGTPRLTA